MALEMALGPLMIGIRGPRLEAEEREWLLHPKVGGVVLFERNLEDPPQLAALVAEIHALRRPPLLVAVDQEGGRVQRLRAPWTEFPPMRTVAGAGGAGAAAAVGRALAVECREAGIAWDFAPVADVDTNPANPVIGDRSFGHDPQAVAACVAAFVRAMQDEGVAACAKHFPGHGDTDEDSHVGLPVVRHDRARLEAVELVPFRAAAAAGVASVMTAHVLVEAIDPRRPATFSPDVLAILREELGFGGLVVTDDLEMGAVAGRMPPEAMADAALRAGADVLLACRSRELQEILLASLEALPDAVVGPALERAAAFVRAFAAPARDAALSGTNSGPPYPEHRALVRDLGGPAARGSDPTERP